MRTPTQRAKDPHRVLPGRRPARLIRAHVVRLPRLHVPPAAVQEPVREALPELLPGSLERGQDANPARNAPLARRPPLGQDPHGPGAHVQPKAPGLVGSTARRRVSLTADGFLAAAHRTGRAHSWASGSPQDFRWSIFEAVRQRRSPARWWPGLFRGPPTARGSGVRGSGSPIPRRASEAFCLRGWSSRVPSTAA